MKTFLKELFVGEDTDKSDLGSILWALGAVVYLVLSIITVCQGHPFEYINFGTGLAAVLAGGGLGAMLKKSQLGTSK